MSLLLAGHDPSRVYTPREPVLTLAPSPFVVKLSQEKRDAPNAVCAICGAPFRKRCGPQKCCTRPCMRALKRSHSEKLYGSPAAWRVTRCGTCKELGHNARTCTEIVVPPLPSGEEMRSQGVRAGFAEEEPAHA